MGYDKPMTSAQRVAKRRAALRAQGLRPRTFWLPDRNSADFKMRAAAATVALDRSWHDQELQGWMDAMIDDVLADYPPPQGYD